VERLAPADQEAGVRPIHAGLVVGDPKAGRAVPALDEVDDAAQTPLAVEDDLLADAPRVVPGARRQPEGQLEREGLPLPLTLHRLVEPGGQSDPNRPIPSSPHPPNRRPDLPPESARARA